MSMSGMDLPGGFAAASFNQTPAFENIDLFSSDKALCTAVARAGVDATAEELPAFGRDFGAAETFELGRLANECQPRLRISDAKGDRLDIVEFHPAYHELMRKSMAAGLHCSAWEKGPAKIAARAARLFIATQVEAGHMCPTTMTNAAVAALGAAPRIRDAWLPHVAARRYDASFRPWWHKSAVTLGMGMTERQGGSDVRANISKARANGDHYLIDGHKWFMSAPMCDGFLVLAQAPQGLTCFLMPRFRPDGSVNGLHIRRLKDKLGNRSNASSEVEFESAHSERLGDEGDGVRIILGMVQMTRLDCAVASAGQMRFGLALAFHHARHRSAFGRRLIEQPAMRQLLADLALESEAATALVFRLARAFDRAPAEPGEAAYARLLTPAIKFHVCKTAPGFIYETLECLGGNGFVEDLPMARLYREAPLNAIWEGAGNVMALDVLRAAGRMREGLAGQVGGLAEAAGVAGAPLAHAILSDLRSNEPEARARGLAANLARLASLAALQEADPRLAEAYRATRCGLGERRMFGASDLGAAEGVLLDRILLD
jgi:putative acyl-CoA dehydrogenase